MNFLYGKQEKEIKIKVKVFDCFWLYPLQQYNGVVGRLKKLSLVKRF